MATKTDNFNRANETPLGSPWLNAGLGNTINLSGNELLGSNANSDHGAYIDSADTSFGNDQTSEIVLATLDSLDYAGPLVRCAGSGATFDGYSVIFGGTNEWYLSRYDNGSPTIIDSGSQTISAGTPVQLDVNGTTLDPQYNSTSLGTTTDSTYSSGQPGVSIYNEGSGAAALDDFSATDGVSGVTIPVMMHHFMRMKRK